MQRWPVAQQVAGHWAESTHELQRYSSPGKEACTATAGNVQELSKNKTLKGQWICAGENEGGDGEGGGEWAWLRV